VTNGTSCSDGNACNGTEQCTAGSCLSTAPLNCNDSNPCTLDPCDPVTGCGAHPPAPSGTTCSDGNLCTLGDTCNGAGSCSPGTTPLVCNDSQECTGDSCNPASGCVFAPRTGACTDDGNECTTDTCGGGVCTHPARTGPCTDDGNECTTDTCAGGVCAHPARTGACTDDGNACTNDVCTAGACAHPNRSNGTACDEGGFCSVNDTCQDGVCTAGPARNCGDTDACTTDTCDEAGDACVHTTVSPCCGDGVPEGSEACDDGNGSNTDDCLNTCVLPTCGDGFLHAGVEQCDQGAANANTPNASCRTDCRAQRCGDGVLDDLFGEQCDDGGTTGGDGCSAACGIEPPATGERIPGKGSPLTDCALEWLMDRPAPDRNGIPSFKQSCRDGDPACDFGTASDECTFRVWLCANNNDVRLPLCTAGGPGVGLVFRVDTVKPNIRDVSRRPEDFGNRQALQRAASQVAVSTFDTCGPRMEIRVPLKNATTKGVKVLRVKGFTSADAKDVDVLKLSCEP
jgi:cysteine-rich repeat protein